MRGSNWYERYVGKSNQIELNWSELARAVFKAKGIKSGLWQFAVKLRFAGMNMQISTTESTPDRSLAVPSSVTAIEGVALFPVQIMGPMVFDAGSTAKGKRPTAAPKPQSAKSAPSKKAALAKSTRS